MTRPLSIRTLAKKAMEASAIMGKPVAAIILKSGERIEFALDQGVAQAPHNPFVEGLRNVKGSGRGAS